MVACVSITVLAVPKAAVAALHVENFMNFRRSLFMHSAVPCRYSMFFTASLLVTLLTLTAAMLRALTLVRFAAACTQVNSTCLVSIQTWLYDHLLQGAPHPLGSPTFGLQDDLCAVMHAHHNEGS